MQPTQEDNQPDQPTEQSEHVPQAQATNIRKGSIDTAQKQTKQQDMKSVFVQSVDYGATVNELQTIFQDCGTIVRATILRQNLTGKSKGCAYVQFAELQSVYHAMMLSGTILRKRAIKVSQKRTNIRGMSSNRGMGNQLLFSKLFSTFGHRGRGRGF